MQSALTLDAEFGRSDGRAHHLRFKEFDPTKTANEIKASLTKLTKLSIFDKNEISLFNEVRHATVIKKVEKEIFDTKKAAKEEIHEVPAAAPERTELPTQVKTEPISQVQAPVESIEATETIRIPEDLTIINEYAKPGWLIQTIELPKGVNSWDLSETHAFMLLNACLPAHTTLQTLEAEDQSVPAKLVVTARITGEIPKMEKVTAANKESPPIKSKKNRKRLLDRIRRRE